MQEKINRSHQQSHCERSEAISSQISKSSLRLLRCARNDSRGFTLIEVLIALVIIAIALLAILKISSFDIENTTYVEQKAVANLLATNVITQAQLNLVAPSKNQAKTLLHKNLYWSLTQTSTPNPHISKLLVSIRTQPNNTPILTLWGFKYE